MMRRLVSAFTLATVIAHPSYAATETMFQKLLRVSGLTANPSQMRGPGDDLDPGDVWVANVGEKPMPLTTGGGYSSPIFSPADGSLLALKGDSVVRIPAAGGAGVVVQKAPSALKLIGFDGANPDEVVVLLGGGGSSPLAILSLSGGKLTPLPYDTKADDQRRMIAQGRSQQRVYGDTTLYIKTESRQGLSRTTEWTDVYIQRGNTTPQNVSSCDGVNCGQPARSPDGRKIAFVKSGG
jgi:hypothetical protein